MYHLFICILVLMQKQNIFSKVLILAQLVPEPNCTAAGKRMIDLISDCKLIASEVVLLGLNPKSEFAFDLNSIGVKTLFGQINTDEVDEILQSENPEMVIFDRFYTEEQCGWKVTQWCPNALKVLDMEDFHALRNHRAELAKQQTQIDLGITPNFYNRTDVLRELASIYRCDLSLVISMAEITILHQLGIPKHLLLYYPFSFPPIQPQNQSLLKKDLLMVGNFLHLPNKDAYQYIHDHVAPLLLQKFPNVTIHVIGAYAQGKITPPKTKNTTLHYWQKNLVPFYQQSMALLAPLRFGAGLKGKVFESLSLNTPVIGSEIAFEGTTICASTPLQPNAIIAEIGRLIQETKYRETKLLAQQKQLLDNFNPIVIQKAFISTLEVLKNNLHTHRNQNLVGKILYRENHRSTEFFSRWIALKNKG